MKELPSVSCMCLTYGRPHLLEEAIQCFLDQDYKGQKELIVFNDLPQQEFLYTHPQVKIINLKERYKTIGEKRNACVDFCTGDLLFVWDDDDLYLPWRITLSVRMIGKNEYFKSSKAWFINNGVISGPTKNLFHSASCFTKSLFFRAGKYDEINSGQDLTMEKKFVDLQSRPITSLSNRDLYYIYRWQGTDSYHLSAFGMDKMDTKRPSGARLCEMAVQKSISEGKLKTGRFNLKPHYKMDYLKAVYDKSKRRPATHVQQINCSNSSL